MLVNFGKFAGPESHALNLKYHQGIYSYPSEFFCFWPFGYGYSDFLRIHYSPIRRLSMRWADHALDPTPQWILLLQERLRVGLIGLFPTNGSWSARSDSRALSIAAWLALPEEIGLGRMALSGCLSGGARLVFPRLGVSITLTIVRICGKWATPTLNPWTTAGRAGCMPVCRRRRINSGRIVVLIREI